MTSELPMICSPRFTGAFPHLSLRSQTHSGLNALTAYWKPTGGLRSVLRINYCNLQDFQKHIFSSNEEQIRTELWAVGSGHPSAAQFCFWRDHTCGSKAVGMARSAFQPESKNKIQVVGKMDAAMPTCCTTLRMQLPALWSNG